MTMDTENTCPKTASSITGSPKPESLENLQKPSPISALKSDEVHLAEKVMSISRQMRKLQGNSMEELIMVDTIQRLGMDHLFQQEIKEVLHRHHLVCLTQSSTGLDGCTNGLREVSLRFRLLRQGGYNVPASIFEDFIGKDRKFMEELGKDTQGLLSLFEASQMSTHGEWIIDEASAFSKWNLSLSLETPNEYHMVVQNALNYPIQMTLTRFTAHDFLGTLSSANGWRNELHELAKMDFNAAQNIYQDEIHQISNWWKKLGLAKELKFARDQPRKWHMWSLAALPEPSFSEQRMEMTKPISFIYIIDDIFDVYGTPEDLALFTEAVKGWDIDTVEMLPDYMKLCLKALFDVTNEISYSIWLKYGCNPKDSLQKAWADVFNAFLVESKWLVAGYLPTSTEYLKVATVTSGIPVLLAHMYFILGGGSNTYESNRLALERDYTQIISSTAMILRLWDDLGSSEDEDQDGHDGSYIKCYMNEKEGVSIENARERVIDLISGAWKSLNQESLQSPSYPFPPMKAFTRGCLNLSRMVPLMYSYDENHTLPDLEKFVTMLLSHRY